MPKEYFQEFSFQPSTLFSRFIDIESIERTSKTCSTFGRPCVISPDRDFSYINVTNIRDIKIDIKRVPKKKELLAAMEAADVKKKLKSSSWGRKLIVQKRRANLNDFDRFKLMLAKIKRAGLVKSELAKLKKQSA